MSKKKLIAVCAVCAVVVLTVIVGLGAKPRLSSLPEEKLIQYLNDAGVIIPEEIANDIRLNELVADLEEDPDLPAAVSWDVLADLHEAVRAVVKDYYGIK